MVGKTGVELGRILAPLVSWTTVFFELFSYLELGHSKGLLPGLWEAQSSRHAHLRKSPPGLLGIRHLNQLTEGRKLVFSFFPPQVISSVLWEMEVFCAVEGKSRVYWESRAGSVAWGTDHLVSDSLRGDMRSATPGKTPAPDLILSNCSVERSPVRSSRLSQAGAGVPAPGSIFCRNKNDFGVLLLRLSPSQEWATQ